MLYGYITVQGQQNVKKGHIYIHTHTHTYIHTYIQKFYIHRSEMNKKNTVLNKISLVFRSPKIMLFLLEG